MSFGELAAFFFGGALIVEGTGYMWHRWVCHAGVFKPLFKDLLRRRHFDHHVAKYPIPDLRHDTYLQSCDISFQIFAIILIIFTGVAAVLGWLRLLAAITLLCGILTYAFLGTKVHALYHINDRSAQRLSILKCRSAWRVFSWLRTFHEVHHVVNANYSLLLPLFDLIGGTYISPKFLSQLRMENLFPLFDPVLSSSCEEPLF